MLDSSSSILLIMGIGIFGGIGGAWLFQKIKMQTSSNRYFCFICMVRVSVLL